MGAGRLLLVCIYLGLVAPSLAQWKVHKEVRSVKAKNKDFKCSYTLRYKGALTVDTKKSKVVCLPDSKGSFGSVTQTFVIRGYRAEILHDIRKGKDKIKKINIGKVTTTEAPTTTPEPTTQPPTGETGGGSGGTGGAGGSNSEDDMSCSCKLPLLGDSSESGRKLSNVASKVFKRKKRSTEGEFSALERGKGHNHAPSYSYTSGYNFGSLVQVLVLASLAALAAYGKVTLVQNLAGLLGRSLNDEILNKEESHARLLSFLNHSLERQDLGGLLGELGNLLGSSSNGGETPGANELEAIIEQVIQGQINEFLTGGGIENFISNLVNTETIGETLGEMVGNMLGNMDMESMIESLSEQLGNDLGEIVAMLDEAISGSNMTEVLSATLGGMPENEIEGLLEGVNLDTMEMMMNCKCNKNN